jgi:hypothetical protein
MSAAFLPLGAGDAHLAEQEIGDDADDRQHLDHHDPGQPTDGSIRERVSTRSTTKAAAR